jgi:hypothetical protein
MKKYTNKIIIIAVALFIIVATVKFFVKAHEVKKEINYYEIIK